MRSKEGIKMVEARTVAKVLVVSGVLTTLAGTLLFWHLTEKERAAVGRAR